MALSLIGFKDNLYEAYAEFTDPEGERSTVQQTFTIDDDTAASVDQVDIVVTNWASNLAALSNATLTNVRWTSHIAQAFTLPSEPSSGKSDIEDKAFIEVVDAFGNRHTQNIPAPANIFLADGETVQPSNLAVAAWLTFVTTSQNLGTTNLNFVTNAGKILHTYIKGYLRRAKTRRRLRQGIWTEIGG